MREGFDKEIDSLLRRTARAYEGARGNGAGTSGPDTHLDADELAAFAEGALPEAARMNAISHLADCGDCRALAVNLTRAAGVEAELEKRAVAAASPSKSSEARESKEKATRGWLASLFAPRTLRYVTPVLALCLVAAVSYVALRSRSDRNSLARLEKGSSSAPSSVTTSQNSAQTTSEGLSNTNSSANANASSTATGTEESPRGERGLADTSVPKPENKDAKEDAPDGSAAPAPVREGASGRDADEVAPPPAKVADDTPAAEAPRDVAKSAPVESAPASKAGEHMKAGPPPPPPAQTNEEVAANDASQQQKRAAQPRNMEPQAPDGSRNQRSAANNAAVGGSLAGTSRDDREARLRRDNSSASRRGRSEQDAASESERRNTSDDTRAVAGHRFRREGGAWVDFNYRSSMDSTGVRRGTDAYRALVAKFPEIGRVAEQLGGEVTIVVRGRAYSIR